MDKSKGVGRQVSTIKLGIIIVRNILKSRYVNLRIRFSKNTLSENHFKYWSQSDHINLEAFQKIETLMNKKPHVIIETGTSAWGTESTRFWDAYIRKYGGELWSVDIRSEPRARLKFQTSSRTNLIVGDSVNFLKNNGVVRPTVVFLDSWDVDWSNPTPAAEHGLKEFKAVLPKIQTGTLIFIDDTPSKLDYIADIGKARAAEYLKNEGVLPGKGSEIIKFLEKTGITPSFHGYAVIFEFHDNLRKVI